eukprot:scaffold139220_cov30-Prasinocladus_malaysianus.AAC.1
MSKWRPGIDDKEWNSQQIWKRMAAKAAEAQLQRQELDRQEAKRQQAAELRRKMDERRQKATKVCEPRFNANPCHCTSGVASFVNYHLSWVNTDWHCHNAFLEEKIYRDSRFISRAAFSLNSISMSIDSL